MSAYRWSLILCIATIGAMAVSSNVWIWSLLRLMSGISSGLVFVLVSSIVLDELAKQNRSALSGVFYGGVGLGIAVTGMLIPAIGPSFGWRGTWFWLMVLTILLGIPSLLWIRQRATSVEWQQAVVKTSDTRENLFSWLLLAYGLEGLGYIITGTFLVDMISKMPAMHGLTSYSWIIVGVTAIPSCIIWAYLGRRLGDVAALLAAYLLQAVGVLLPIIVPDAFGGYVGALLFGGTFMGITTLATTLGQKLRPNDSGKAIGLMTGVYGIGQIVGAGGAGLLASQSGGFGVPTLVASGVLFIGAVILTVGSRVTSARGRSNIGEYDVE